LRRIEKGGPAGHSVWGAVRIAFCPLLIQYCRFHVEGRCLYRARPSSSILRAECFPFRGGAFLWRLQRDGSRDKYGLPADCLPLRIAGVLIGGDIRAWAADWWWWHLFTSWPLCTVLGPPYARFGSAGIARMRWRKSAPFQRSGGTGEGPKQPSRKRGAMGFALEGAREGWDWKLKRTKGSSQTMEAMLGFGEDELPKQISRNRESRGKGGGRPDSAAQSQRRHLAGKIATQAIRASSACQGRNLPLDSGAWPMFRAIKTASSRDVGKTYG